MFKVNKKQHIMKLRTTTKYKTTRTKTERLKRSAIPYMEKILNEAHQEEFRASCGSPKPQNS